MTGGLSKDGKYRWACPDCGKEMLSNQRPVSCDGCDSRQTPEWVGRSLRADIDRYREMKEAVHSLRRAAEMLEDEAITVKHNSEPENGEYLTSVLDKAVENVQSLDIETNRSAEGQR